MGVILEFTIPAVDFQLGEVLHTTPALELELERVVPTGHMVMPFVWATGENHDDFEASVREHPNVDAFVVLDRLGDSVLYRIDWVDAPADLIEGIAASDAIVMEARGNGEWVFRLRFPNHQQLSTFHNFVIEEDLQVQIDRTYTLTEETEVGRRFGLTPEQREALVLALRRGYFATPHEVTLEEIAEELGISRQAVSVRIRLGNEAVLQKALLSKASNLK